MRGAGQGQNGSAGWNEGLAEGLGSAGEPAGRVEAFTLAGEEQAASVDVPPPTSLRTLPKAAPGLCALPL